MTIGSAMKTTNSTPGTSRNSQAFQVICLALGLREVRGLRGAGLSFVGRGSSTDAGASVVVVLMPVALR